jgi:hypothetical protein
MLVAEDDRRVYQVQGNAGLAAVLTLGISVAVLAVLIVALWWGTKSNRLLPMQGAFTFVLGLTCVFMIIRGLQLLRTTSRVIIDKDGMRLEGPRWGRSIAWSDVERIEKKEYAPLVGENQDAVVLLGANGRRLGEVRACVDRFAELVQQMTDRSTLARGEATVDFAADEAAMIARSKRKLRIKGIICTPIVLMFAFAVAWGLYEWMHQRRYATEGVPIEAKLVFRSDYGGSYPALSYEFRDAQGQQFRRSVSMERWGWEGLQGAQTVRVVYLPSNPRWNRPVVGMHDLGMGKTLPVMAFGLVMAIVYTVACFLGYQYKPRDGSMKLLRWGRPVN